MRSLVVLRDRYGSEIGPLLKRGHKEMQSGRSSTMLTDAQIVDLAHFLRQRVNDSLRGSPIFQAQNVLTGDAKAGEAYFNGEGKCSSCHSPTGNLAGIGTRLEPVDLQQRFLFPGDRAGRARTRARRTGRTVGHRRDGHGHAGRRAGGHRRAGADGRFHRLAARRRRATCGRSTGRRR